MYTNNMTCIMVANGIANLILAGIYQGCPLSGLLISRGQLYHPGKPRWRVSATRVAGSDRPCRGARQDTWTITKANQVPNILLKQLNYHGNQAYHLLRHFPASAEEDPILSGKYHPEAVQGCILQENAAARSVTENSVGSSAQVMSHEAAPPDDDAGNESHDLGPQTDTPSEIISNPIDDSNVLAEQTLRIWQLLLEPTTEESGKPRPQTNPNNAQQIQGLYRRNRRRAVRVIVQGESKLCELPLDKLEEHFAAKWAPKTAQTGLLLNKTRHDDMAEVCLARFTSDELAAHLRKCDNTIPGERQHNVLAYADDFTPLADEPRKLQDRIDVIATLATQLGLRLNPKKCRSLPPVRKDSRRNRVTKFFVDGEEILRNR
ncbi:hypothetical protein MTO96_037357 [Rhipicephalus appendiculatus]